jgi:triacylglycerol lipase
MPVSCDTKYPVVLVHGVGSRDGKHHYYWGRIPRILAERGARVYYGNQDSNGSIESNAAQLRDSVLKVLDETGSPKVNILAHSKGGLDSRYLISSLDMGGNIASLTTFSTPHHGSATVDRLLAMPDPLVRAAAFLANSWFRLLGDKTPDSYKLFRQLTTGAALEFNRQTPNCDGVYYQSYAFVMNTAFSDLLMLLHYLVVKRFEGENDGLVIPSAAEWCEFRGVIRGAAKRGVSHMDEVDMRKRRFAMAGREDMISDITALYIDIVSELRSRGF